MIITSIQVGNFKALDTELLDLKRLNCIWSLNGEGKSTTLQLLDFLSRLMSPYLGCNYVRRDVQITDLTWYQSKEPIYICVGLEDDKGQKVAWDMRFNPKTLQCEVESIGCWGYVLKVSRGTLLTNHKPPSGVWSTHQNESMIFTYTGSVLSSLADLPQPLKDLRDFFRGFQSVTPRTNKDIAEVFSQLPDKECDTVVAQLQTMYPQLVAIQSVYSVETGRVGLEFVEAFRDIRVCTYMDQVSSGMMRMLNLLMTLRLPHSLLMLDDFDNGLNTESVERLLGILNRHDKSLYLTTLSPMVRNRLKMSSDHGVVALARDLEGKIRAKSF